jgi:serine/threonine-protein kinase
MEEKALFLATVVLLFRALILPTPAVWTLALTTAGAAPVAISLAAIYYENPAPDAAASPALQTGLAVLRIVIVIAIASIASTVIYNLRRRVHEARQLGQYTLEEKLGEGAMGVVYRARHAMLRRPTAVKLLRPENTSEAAIARFEREVQLTSRLTHPNTIAIYDYGRTPDGVFYYAMEYLPGIALRDLVERHGTLPEGRIIHLLKQAAGSLGDAHRQGLIHRDVKPANIFACERGGLYDVVKVLDFGLVRDTQHRAEDSLAAPEKIAGTPHYMSPEAIQTPEELDGRSDIYSLGATGYFLLTGKPVFTGRSAIEVLTRQLNDVPEPPSVRTTRTVSPDLEGVIMSCLAKDPDKRPADAGGLIEALDRCEEASSWSQNAARRWWGYHTSRTTAVTAATASAEVPPAMTVELKGRRNRDQ